MVVKELINKGYKTPWEVLSYLIRSLNDVNMLTWKEYKFSEKEAKIFQQVFTSETMALDFYNTFRKLSLRAAAYKASKVPIESSLARSLANDWHDMVRNVTEGNEEILTAFQSVDKNREQWNLGERHLIEKAEALFRGCCKVSPD